MSGSKPSQGNSCCTGCGGTGIAVEPASAGSRFCTECGAAMVPATPQVAEPNALLAWLDQGSSTATALKWLAVVGAAMFLGLVVFLGFLSALCGGL